jgi:hypothetical protein
MVGGCGIGAGAGSPPPLQAITEMANKKTMICFIGI